MPPQFPGDPRVRVDHYVAGMDLWARLDDLETAGQLGEGVIGGGIRAGRLRLGWSQQQLAWRVGVSQSVISRLETGRLRGMRFRTLARIVGVLEASPGYAFPDGPRAPTRRLPGQRAA